jgi:hypothetical protein
MFLSSDDLSPEARKAHTLRVTLSSGGTRYGDADDVLAELIAGEVMSLELPAKKVAFSVVGPHLHFETARDCCGYLGRRFDGNRAWFEVFDTDTDTPDMLVRLLDQVFKQHLVFLQGLRLPSLYTQVWKSYKAHAEAGCLCLLGERGSEKGRGSDGLAEALTQTGNYEVAPVDAFGLPWWRVVRRVGG